ncbi:uncharacterized protein LOC115435766 isoform X2 [Sphaeramia orbicularis]|uniref:uncharacterized protein LOC115435766 isoform X2 n=1 Tax=Sphaeramia orbicularis TaxID=375764 RepID=UPI00117F241F|nr:uncharacterized protein LOC115435766 isoform X2 [Sphaeramia orbicularis]
MSAKGISTEILDCLQSLRKEDFDSFVFRLKDRREEPRIRGSKVDRKSRVVVTEVLVSTFTESRALEVTVDILRGMGCNQEADDLESGTKAPLDALRNFKLPAKKPEEVEAEAKEMVKSEGGDPFDKRLVLSRFMIQFGQYRDQTFKWLLENDVDYVAMILALHRREREDGSKNQHPVMANKDSLARYAACYPDFVELINLHYEGQALIGFGKFEDITLQDLYDSTDEEKVSYVNFLRRMEDDCIPRSKMDVAIRYILRRDQERPAVMYRLPTSGTQPSGPQTTTKRKRGGESWNAPLKRGRQWNW